MGVVLRHEAEAVVSSLSMLSYFDDAARKTAIDCVESALLAERERCVLRESPKLSEQAYGKIEIIKHSISNSSGCDGIYFLGNVLTVDEYTLIIDQCVQRLARLAST